MNKKFETIGDQCIHKYPEKLPIVVHYSKQFTTTSYNYLVKNDSTIGQFIISIRQKISLNYCEMLLICIGNQYIDESERIDMLFTKYKNSVDGCLHLSVEKKVTFKV